MIQNVITLIFRLPSQYKHKIEKFLQDSQISMNVAADTVCKILHSCDLSFTLQVLQIFVDSFGNQTLHLKKFLWGCAKSKPAGLQVGLKIQPLLMFSLSRCLLDSQQAEKKKNYFKITFPNYSKIYNISLSSVRKHFSPLIGFGFQKLKAFWTLCLSLVCVNFP